MNLCTPVSINGQGTVRNEEGWKFDQFIDPPNLIGLDIPNCWRFIKHERADEISSRVDSSSGTHFPQPALRDDRRDK